MHATTRLAAAAAALLLSAGAARAIELTVEVVNARSAQGSVQAGLYTSAGAWMKADGIVAGQRGPALPDKTVLVFRNLQPGGYAVAAFHDENGNGKLDSNVVGIPTERFGFSRDARGTMGPPKYGDAVIDLNADATITIKLN